MKHLFLSFGLVLVMGLVGCASAPPPPAPTPTPTPVPTPTPTPLPSPTPTPTPTPLPPPAPDRVEVSRDGFSPLASSPNHTIRVQITWGAPDRIIEWALVIADEVGNAVRTTRGTTTIPHWDWDGKTDAGPLAPQGKYKALLSTAGADGALRVSASSAVFFLDIVPPSGTIKVTPSPFVLGPADVIVNPPSQVTIELTLVNGGAPWTLWRLAVLHPDGRRFRDFISEEHRDNRLTWDGRAVNNAQLEAGTIYRLEAEVFDVYGNRGVVTGSLAVQAPPPPPPPQKAVLTVTFDGKLLSEQVIFFPPYSADFGAVTGPQRDQNQKAIAVVADLLKAAGGTRVDVIGHANQVLYQDPVEAAAEQKETLLPLSKARAEAVKQALVSVGLAGETLVTQGVGASNPLAEFSDSENRWKNRRVELEVAKN